MKLGSGPGIPQSDRVRIVVASSVMLTFITYWRAAAIILNDLGSSAFYVGGIAEQAFGPSAPWFILGVMLFSFAVRAVYVESCSMFVRGGVYKIVKEALGGRLAKLAVSALMFDYILTGPVSGVSAGQYIAWLVNDTFKAMTAHGWMPQAAINMFGGVPQLNVNATAVVLAITVTIYYWWENIKGIEESSEKALRITQITALMVVLLLGWSAITLLQRGGHIPPLPTPQNLYFTEESLGFLKHHGGIAQMFGIFGILMAFGHSVLAMSGEETLAQVYREIAHPKLKNLKRTALIVAVFSFVFTGIVTLLAFMIVPDQVRAQYSSNLIAGLVMYLSGPQILRLVFRAFVVVVGFLMLSGAINTAIVGSNGVLNRVSEDGVLTDWFRKPHKKFGTSYRNINLVVGLQLITIVASRGDIYVLGEAYAFGVIWSFVFNSLAMLVLRYKYKGERGWKVPPNITIFGREIPIGLLSVHLVLLSLAVVNLFTKSVATVAGLIFAGVFFAIFTISERVNRRKLADAQAHMKEQFQLVHSQDVQRQSLGIRPGNVLVTVRDYNTLNHLRWVLERTDTKEQDVVCLAARVSQFSAAGFDVSMDQVFGDYEQTLFTRAVAIAEKYGKHVSLLVVPARDVWSAIVQTANQLESSAVVAGLSSKMTAQEQAFRLGRAWEEAPEPKRQFIAQIVRPDLHVETFRIGPHTPAMRTEDVHLVHRIWLHITREPGLEKLHHSDIVSLALTRFARDFGGHSREEILKDLRRLEDKRFGRVPAGGLVAELPVSNAPDGTAEGRKEPPVLGP
ncbi:MAG TPA: APC family permease [Terriglobales bacterium]|nr:APC family permease [Terriglobales bacterium]